MSKQCVTKDKLLQEAFDLIWNNSYGAVSVGDICDRAGVNKGSFYHFFESKADLAVEAYEAHWQEKQPHLDRIFSPQVAPLVRLHGYCEFLYNGQVEKAAKYGRVCGCPYGSIGTEVATQDDKIRVKSQEILMRGRKYLESTIADAMREGSVNVKDPATAARRVHSLVLGMLMDARMQNDLEVLKDLETSILALLGATEVIPASA